MAAKILIVDDEAPFRASIRCYLVDEGYSVIEAESGLDAIKTFQSDQPHIVLLDLRMPQMSGIEVLRGLRALSMEVSIIMVSGGGEIAEVVEAMRLGASDYVLKPIPDMRILRKSVERGIEHQRMERENRAYRTRLEELIVDRTSALAAANTALQRKTIALEEILATYRTESARRTARLIERIDQFMRPILESGATERPELLSQFEAALASATSESLDQMAQKLSGLTPAELRICEMILRGMGSKEIAAVTRTSADTVETHRRNIRRKLHINNETVNLATFLRQALDDGAA